MMYYSLDQIVRSVLLKESKSLHYYIQYLSYAVSCLSKLNTTTSRNVNSKQLPVNSYNSITLPPDYEDWVQVGFIVGERIRPLIFDPKLVRLNNVDSSGNKIPWPSTLPDGTQVYDISGSLVSDQYSSPYYSGDLIYQQPFFNRPTDRDDWAFKVLKERNEIQLSNSYPYSFVVLDYITDGRSTDAATKVDPLSAETIEKYIRWQTKLHARTYSDSERAEAERLFYQEWRLLRAAKNNLTKADIIHAVRSGYTAIYKN